MKNGADFSYDALSGLDEMDSFSVCLGVSQGYGVAISYLVRRRHYFAISKTDFV